MSYQIKLLQALVWILVFALFLGAIYLAITTYPNFKKLNFNTDLINNYYSLQKDNNNQDQAKQQQFATLYNSGNFLELNKQLDQELANNPNNFTLLLQKANSLAQEASLTFKEKELGDKALVYVNQALQLQPDSVEALTLKGYIYEIQQDYTKAHSFYDQALKIDPNNSATLAQKGHAYDLMGRVNEARVLYRKAIDVDQNNEKAIIGLSRIYLQLGEYTNATSFLKKVLEVSHNSRYRAEAYYSLGLISEQKTYSKVSYDYYLQAKEADPSFSLVYVGLAKQEFLNNHIDESFEYIETSLKLNPHQTSAGFQLAMQYYTLGNKDIAKKIFIQLKEEVPKDITLNSVNKKVILITIDQILKSIK